MSSSTVAPVAIFLLLTTASACSEPEPISPACMEATMHEDLAFLQEKVFTPQCSAFSACHMGTAPDAEGLNLEDGRTHTSLVNVDGKLFPDYKLVVPGDPENSYIMIALGQYPGPLGRGGTMPYNNPLLCKEKRDAIERWIAAGAQP